MWLFETAEQSILNLYLKNMALYTHLTMTLLNLANTLHLL